MRPKLPHASSSANRSPVALLTRSSSGAKTTDEALEALRTSHRPTSHIGMTLPIVYGEIHRPDAAFDLARYAAIAPASLRLKAIATLFDFNRLLYVNI
jgi:hypothetical protein